MQNTNINDYSVQELIRFLDYAIENNLIKKNTGSNRKTAINKILLDNKQLTSQEISDVRNIDIEKVISSHAYNNLNPYSVHTYKSRLYSAIRDFKRWRRDPVKFKGCRQYVKHKYDVVAVSKKQDRDVTLDMTIPIRNNKILVKVHNIPFDITAKEAEGISNIISAYQTAWSA